MMKMFNELMRSADQCMKFLLLMTLCRSWLLSEGLISSEGELLDSSSVDAEWGGPHVPPASSPQTSSPNPYSSPPLKNSSSSNLSASVPPKKVAQPVSSFSSGSVAEPTPKTQISSSTNNSDNPTQTPVSTKFSSPQKKRRSQPAASETQVTLESLRPDPRWVAYLHPYHPEPWTSESPILLLLSRFSHAGDPSAALVSPRVMSGLLFYLTHHQDPSTRCFRMLCRLSCNPYCLEALLRTGSVALVRHHLCSRGDGPRGRERQTDRVKAKVKQLGETNTAQEKPVFVISQWVTFI